MTLDEKRAYKRAYMREYYRTHKADMSRNCRTWRERHREAYLAYQRAYRANRRRIAS